MILGRENAAATQVAEEEESTTPAEEGYKIRSKFASKVDERDDKCRG